MKKKHKKFWVIFIIVLFIALISLIKYLHAELIQRSIKNNFIIKVATRQACLNEAIAEMKNKDLPDVIQRTKTDGESYEVLDNETITKVFNEFPVVRIQNEMDNSEGGYVYFFTLADGVYLARKNYSYGFYYSEEDKPLDIYSGDNMASTTKVEVKLSSYDKYWYWTEKIADNWWYFEAHFTSNNNVWK